MAKHYDFEFVLSEASVQKLVSELKKYQNDIKKAKDVILESLAEETYRQVRANIEATTGNNGYIPTGQLLDSIVKSPIMNDMISVYTNLAYAKFVEYGTGIVGSQDSHPTATDAGWQYDSNGHGVMGWRYQGSDGTVYWTQGLEAHSFMYNAWLYLKENYMDIARRVLRERGIIK